MSDDIKRLKNVYGAMKNRCTNTNRHNYYRYGGRGIKVCDDWINDIEKFIDWSLKNGYKKGLQIDRINNDGDYSPENCRWVTPKENANNKESNILITYNNETKSIAEWSKIVNIDAKTLYYRYSKGYKVEDLFNHKELVTLEYNGSVNTLVEWSDITGISYKTLHHRYSKGWSATKIIETSTETKQATISYKGETHTVKEWSEILKINPSTLHTRRHSGWSDEEIIIGKRRN